MIDEQAVRERVSKIADMAGDPEAAHGEEDKLHADVLAAIARGAENPAVLAAEALTSHDLEFPRWTA